MGTAHHFIKKGAKKLVLRDYKGTIEDYTKTIHLKNYYASAYNKLGLSKNSLGVYIEAIEYYTKAVKVKFNIRVLIVLFLLVVAGQRDVSDYIAIYLKSDDADAYFEQGNIKNL
jgi:tetratricopeptide (TPR) repeat protein